MNTKILGSNIQKFRLEKKLTQDAVAEQSGLSTVYYRQIELGHKIPRLETFLKIAEVLNIPTDKLLSGNVSWTDSINTYEVMEKLGQLPQKKRDSALAMIDVIIDKLKEI